MTCMTENLQSEQNRELEETRAKEGTLFLKIMIGVMFIPLGVFIAILIFQSLSAPMGVGQEYCFRDNFWITSLNSVLISLALITVFPGSMIVAAIGVMRLIKKQQYGIIAIVAGLLFAPMNLYLAYIPYKWFNETKEETIYGAGKDMLLKLSRAQERTLLDSGSYAQDIEKLGDFSFSDKGRVAITSADEHCFVAEASHECLPKNIVFDSCNGRIQE